MSGRRALQFLLLAGLLAPLAAGADEVASEPEARYAREQLLAEARKAVAPEAPAGEDLLVFQEALRADRVALAEMETGTPLRRVLEETIHTRERLLGPPDAGAAGAPGAPGERGRSAGALAEARWLHRWLLGLEVCAVLVRDAGSADPAAVRSYEWPPPAAPSGAEGKPVPADLETWAQGVVKDVGGTLLRRRIEPAVCATLDDLAALAQSAPTYVPASALEVPRRHAVAGTVASAFEVNEPFLRLRALQSAERIEAYAKDAPNSGLVDEATVREKARRAAELRDEATRLRARRAEIVEDLNRMALFSADAWRQVLGTLGAQIAETNRPANGGEPLSVDGTLAPAHRVQEAQESTALLDLRLLHMTALRADLRQRLIERWTAMVDAEALAAEGAQARFAGALEGQRRERQRVQLEFERDRKLRRGLESADEWLKRHAGTPEPRADGVRALRSLLESLLDVNAIVLEAVRLRALVHDRLQGPAPVAPATAVAAGETGAGAKPAGPSAGPADPLAGLRSPETSALDDAYIAAALERLRDPTLTDVFDADLVAHHHEAVERRFVALREARESSAGLDDLEQRLRRAAAGARERLKALSTHSMQGYAARYAASLEQHEAGFAEALAGLRSDRERLRERLRTFSAYRTALRDAGSRSFLIRGRLGVTAEGLALAAQEANALAVATIDWAALRSEDHAVGFLRDRWAGLLCVLALAAAAVVGVRAGRRALDRRIEFRVEAIPGLRRTGASPTEEREQAQANVEMREAAAKAAEETVLRQAAGDESVAPPPPEEPPAVPPPPPPPAAAPPATPGPAAEGRP